MKFDYNFNKKAYQKALKNKNNMLIYVMLMIGSIAFIVINFKLIIDDLISLSIIFIGYLIFVFLVMRIINHIHVKTMISFYEKFTMPMYGKYKCEVKDNEISQTIGNYQINIPLSSIKKIYYFKEELLIKIYKDGRLYLFDKDGFTKKSDYDKFLKYLEKNYKEKK